MMIKAPFNDEQIRSINEFQHCNYFHPFTCANDSNHVLVAYNAGLMCPNNDCKYTKEWVHNFMQDFSWQQTVAILKRELNLI